MAWDNAGSDKGTSSKKFSASWVLFFSSDLIFSQLSFTFFEEILLTFPVSALNTWDA